MDLEALSEPLTVNQIDFRVQSINNGGYATILAYKDARVDMQRLDDVCGPLNWRREHIRENKNCIVSIWDDEKKQWVSKEDTGTESNAEAEKGLASDSFKRACFNWGIGRELYDYPVISVKLFDSEINEKNGKKYASWNLRLREWKWKAVFEGNTIVHLAAMDQNGNVRFTWNDKNTTKKAAKQHKNSELLNLLASGDELATVQYWRSLGGNEQAQQQEWASIDKDSQKLLKQLLSKYPPQGN